MTSDFSVEQKRYLEGFVSGVQAGRTASGMAPLGRSGPGAPSEPAGPDAIHQRAQLAQEAQGKKLADQEIWKRDEHPFDAYARLNAQADRGDYPKPPDNFRWRYYGLFYVAPAEQSYMCRLRIPNGILRAEQLAGLADVAERFGGGYAHVTTRANLQIRKIVAENAVNVVEAVQDLGLTSRGSGADNIRNVTGTPTAGIDPVELIDTRPYARSWHFHVLNDRSLAGLPRKFNVAFDGAGRTGALEDTNDIGYQAVEVVDGAPVAPGVYFRLALGGITGHRDFARDTGVILEPRHATRVADAIVRVFIEHGDRTNRNKARLKYVLDDWGFERFLGAVEAKLGEKLVRIEPAFVKPRPQPDRMAHLGVHPQKQPGLNWIGVVLSLGKLTSGEMRDLAKLARELGDGDIRLTVWQNLIVSGIPDGKIDEAKARIVAMGLSAEPSNLRAGLVACTGATGCKFGAARTKETAEAIAQFVESRAGLDQPINIHVTGCHHSCAQHYIGDIGLIGAKIPVGDDGRVRQRGPDRARAVARRQERGVPAAGSWPRQRLHDTSREFDRELCELRQPPRDRSARPPCRRSPSVTIQTPPPALPPAITPLIPETAPFSTEQRAWLNGFFAGLLSLEAGPRTATPAEVANAGGAEAAHAGADDAPWHDPTLELPDRMKLAEGRTLRRRMMAAMAQQDCGQCGYNCEAYANAIADQAEPRLNLCSPGGKATARMLKSLVEEMGGGVVDPEEKAAKAAGPVKSSDARPGYSREMPVDAVFLSRRRLTGAGSEKSTNHIEIDLSASGVGYEAGDSLGVFPENDPALVDRILSAVRAPADFPIGTKTLRQALIEDCSLAPAPDALLKLVSYLVGGDRRRRAQALAKGEDPDGDAATLDVLAALEKFPGIHPDPEALFEVLEPLQPRLYSISSSPKTAPGRVTLTVDAVRYRVHERERLGVASTWLGERVTPGTAFKIYVQKAHGFALPKDPAVPVVMVGPGTGIAPFRAFLEERLATRAPGPAWLFFGHQRRATDFFYEDELSELQRKGALTRLSTAWSRDGDRKVYVQDRMREEGAALFEWLERGAHFYICGDAKRMAKDVESALADVLVANGGQSPAAARDSIKAMKASGRYQADVY